MKKVILASAALLTASALILSGCKKDEEEPAPVKKMKRNRLRLFQRQQVLLFPNRLLWYFT